LPPSLLSTPAAKLIIQFGRNCRQANFHYAINQLLEHESVDVNLNYRAVGV
jgi:hypothetical protein